MVEVPEPGAGIGFGLKVMAVVDGVDVKVIAESKPPPIVVMMEVVPELPPATVIEAGEAEMAKLGVVTVVSASIRLLPFGLPHPVDKS